MVPHVYRYNVLFMTRHFTEKSLEGDCCTSLCMVRNQSSTQDCKGRVEHESCVTFTLHLCEEGESEKRGSSPVTPAGSRPGSSCCPR